MLEPAPAFKDEEVIYERQKVYEWAFKKFPHLFASAPAPAFKDEVICERQKALKLVLKKFPDHFVLAFVYPVPLVCISPVYVPPVSMPISPVPSFAITLVRDRVLSPQVVALLLTACLRGRDSRAVAIGEMETSRLLKINEYCCFVYVLLVYVNCLYFFPVCILLL